MHIDIDGIHQCVLKPIKWIYADGIKSKIKEVETLLAGPSPPIACIWSPIKYYIMNYFAY